MKLLLKVLLLFLILCSCHHSYGQSDTVKQEDPPPKPVTGVEYTGEDENKQKQDGQEDGSYLGTMTTKEFMLSCIIVAFGLLMLITTIIIICVGKIHFEPEQYIRLITIILIVTASLVLIASGYDDKQIGGVLGLFGTIIGYLLGSKDMKSQPPLVIQKDIVEDIQAQNPKPKEDVSEEPVSEQINNSSNANDNTENKQN